MKRIALSLLLGCTLFIGSAVFAGDLSIPNTFEAGTKAIAAEVNANFSAVETAVDDNDARIFDLESSTIESVGNVGGNIDMIGGTNISVTSDDVNNTITIALTGTVANATNATNATNADTLDGQHGSYYMNASNINAGTLNVARYSAYSDLADEGYLANASGDVALNNGTVQANLNADMVDGYHYTSFIRKNTTESANIYVTGQVRGATFYDYNNTSRYIDLSSSGTSMYAQGGLRLGAATSRSTSNGGYSRNIIIRHFATNTYTAGTVIYETPQWKVVRAGTSTKFQLITKVAASLNYWIRIGSTYYHGSPSAAGETFTYDASTYNHFEIWVGYSYGMGDFAHLHLNKRSGDYYWDGYIVTTYTN